MGSKVLFGDVVPYEVPSSLSALRGPARGHLAVPVTVHWGPRRVFDLDEVAQRRVAYRAIVREGSPVMQEALLNAAVLRREWRQLVLPERCRRTWEDAFPELAAA